MDFWNIADSNIWPSKIRSRKWSTTTSPITYNDKKSNFYNLRENCGSVFLCDEWYTHIFFHSSMIKKEKIWVLYIDNLHFNYSIIFILIMVHCPKFLDLKISFWNNKIDARIFLSNSSLTNSSRLIDNLNSYTV